MTETTRLAFAEAYAARSGVTVEWLWEQGRIPLKCDCGDEGCEGWQMGRILESPVVERELQRLKQERDEEAENSAQFLRIVNEHEADRAALRAWVEKEITTPTVIYKAIDGPVFERESYVMALRTVLARLDAPTTEVKKHG